jgi:hypothetical protein
MPLNPFLATFLLACWTVASFVVLVMLVTRAPSRTAWPSPLLGSTKARHLLPRLALSSLLPGVPAVIWTEWKRPAGGWIGTLPAPVAHLGGAVIGFVAVWLVAGVVEDVTGSEPLTKAAFSMFPLTNLWPWWFGKPKI